MALTNVNAAALKKISERFKALGAPNRLKIISALKDGELSVSELVERTKLGQSNVSQHLKILQNAGLVTNRKAGSLGLYRIADETLFDLCSLVCTACQNGVD